MKKIIIIMLLIVAFYTNIALASVTTKSEILNYVGIEIEIDNNKIIPKDVLGNVVHPFIIDGTTYLPVRAISEALGKNVEWEGETYSVYITNPNEKKEIKTFSGEIEKKIHQETKTLNYKDISIYINDELIEPKDANGKVVEPFIIDGTTYLPVRAVAEAFNKKVNWIDETKTVEIKSQVAKINNVVIKVIDEILCAEVTTDIAINDFNYYLMTEGIIKAEPYLNMRESTNITSNIISKIPKDEKITIKAVTNVENQDWYKVTYNNVTGWVSANYVDVTSSTRLVIDIENTELAIDTKTKEINYDNIKAIRFGNQGNNISRIVLDLNNISSFKMVQNEEKTNTYFALNENFKLPATIKGENVFVATNDDKLYIPDNNSGDIEKNNEISSDNKNAESEDLPNESINSGDSDDIINEESSMSGDSSNIIIGESDISGDSLLDDNIGSNEVEEDKQKEEIIENLSSVNSIKYSSSTNKTRIKIDGDYEYTSFVLTNPDRVVIDIKGAKLEVDGPKEINPNNKNITAIRFSQNETTIVRVVFDVNAKSDYTITEKKGELAVEIEEVTYKNIDYINYGTYATLVLKNTDIDYFDTEKTSSNKYYITYSSRKFKSGTGTIEVDDEWVEEINIKSSKITIYGQDKTNYSIKQKGEDVVITMKEQSTQDRVILIDAGHGGSDPGACNGSIYEKVYNLKIALKLREMLEETDGVEVRMSRDDDTYIDRNGRLEFVLENPDADLLVSIHNNSLANKNYQGSMVLFYNKPREKEEYGITSKEFATIVKNNLINELETVDRGVISRPDLLILEQNVTGGVSSMGQSNLPAILCEVIFISNDEEAARLQKDSFQQKTAQAIYDGIIEAISIMDNN